MTRPKHLSPRPIVALAALVAAVITASASGGAAAENGTKGKVAGLGISRPGVPQQVIANDLPRMLRTGVNTGMIDVWWDVDDENASTMHPGTITTSDADIALAIQRAKAAGLRVMFEPKIWCPKCQPLHWRGILKPKNRKAFFRNYRAMINHYARIAQDEGVEVYFIGSEMNTLQGDTAEWREIATQARERFRGRLAYEVNWDTWSEPKFWDAVDLVSVSAYFPLSDAARPKLADLKAGWRSSRTKDFRNRNWFEDMATLARTTGKQVLFGECGYLSSTYAARRPYDESARYEPDQQLQADAYQALLETFEGEPWWAGVIWWEWYPTTGSDPGESTTYSPRDKLAEQLLTAWYANAWRPGSPGGPAGRSPVLAPAPLGSILPPGLGTGGGTAAGTADAVASGGGVTPVVAPDAAGSGSGAAIPIAGTGDDASRLPRRALKIFAALLVIESFIGHRALVRRRTRARRVRPPVFPAPAVRTPVTVES